MASDEQEGAAVTPPPENRSNDLTEDATAMSTDPAPDSNTTASFPNVYEQKEQQEDDNDVLLSPTPAARNESLTELNDAELANIVSAISPDLSALLSDEALDSFLNDSIENTDGDKAKETGGTRASPARSDRSEIMSGRKVSGGDGGGGDSGDDDSVDHEMSRLSAAESSLREELDMIGGLGALMSSPMRETKTVVEERIVEKVVHVDEARGKGSLVDGEEEGGSCPGHDEEALPSPPQRPISQAPPPPSPPSSPPAIAPSSSSLSRAPMQYTYADHAVQLSVQSLPADMGCVSVPLLSREDIMDMFPPFDFKFDEFGSAIGATGTDAASGAMADLGGDLDAEDAAAVTEGNFEIGGDDDDKDDGKVVGTGHGLAGAYEELANPTSSSQRLDAPANDNDNNDTKDNDNANQTEKEKKSEEQAQVEHEEFVTTTQNCFREYVRPVSPPKLRKMFAGLVEPIDTQGRTMGYIKEVGGEATPGASADNRPARNASDDNMQGGGPQDSNRAGDQNDNINQQRRAANSEPIPPIRTVTVRIRPDVLCGAVMDAVSTAVTDVGGEITKRRGGHLRCAVPGYWLGRGTKSRQTSTNELDGMGLGNLDGSASTTPAYLATPGSSKNDAQQMTTSSFSNLLSSPFSSSKMHGRQGKRKGAILLPPTIVDVQLVTRKLSRECERLLLIRVYRSDDPTFGSVGNASDHLDYISVDVDSMGLDLSHHGMTECPIEEWGGILLREAGSLVQKIEEYKSISIGIAEVNAGGCHHPQQHGRDVPISAAVVRETVGVSLPPTPSDIPDNFTPAASSSVVGKLGDKSSGIGSGRYMKAFGSMLTSPFRSPLHGTTNSSRAGGAPSAGMYPDHRSATEGASIYLRRNFKRTVSVLEAANNGSAAKNKLRTITSLCFEDYAYIQSSWRFLQEILSELDSRTLSYPTLSSYSFGAFPSLPTVDVHYCSQLRLVSRENMILSLIKMASELEGYAREAEYSTANLIQILRVTYGDYGMDEPALPMPLPLSAYPLDFEPHEAVCPPWGMKVMEALNRVAASSSPGGTGTAIDPNDISLRKAKGESRSAAGYRAARDAVALVASAFQRQADEEQSARIGHKNVQVLDRLAKMQAHKRLSVLTLRGAYGKNTRATKAADELNRRIEKYLPKKDEEDDDDKGTDQALLSFFTPVDRVPLLKCGIAIGATSSGTCYITANELVCITQAIPFLGGKRCYEIPIPDVELTVNEASTSLMNPLASESITVRDLRATKDGENAEDFTFIPALVAKRFKAFVDVVKDVVTEDPETLKFSVRGGLIYASNDTTQKEPVLLSRPEKQRTVKSDNYASML